MAKTILISVASGSTNSFPITYPYLDKTHSHVYINGVETQNYTWVSDGMITLLGAQVPSGTLVERRRITPDVPIVTFRPGNLGSDDLNVSNLQPIYMAQEARDLGEYGRNLMEAVELALKQEIIDRKEADAALASVIGDGSRVMDAPMFESVTAASLVTIAPHIRCILVGGDAVRGDGEGGLFVDVDTGGSSFLSAGGRAWFKVRDVAEDRLSLEVVEKLNSRKPAVKEKWLMSSDWQCIPGDAAQVAYQRSMMTKLTEQHPDFDYAFYPGDLVDRASNDGDGSAPAYGYPEFRKDIESRTNIPWGNWQFLPGNHDRDGTGLGAFKEAWSYMTYRKYLGSEFYVVRKGNVAHILIGDMAGSNSGEILPFVLDWLKAELNALEGFNVFCWFHQPLHGVHPSSLSETSAWSQYEGATGLRPILATYKDRIVFCGYGHVGVGTSTGTTFSKLDDIDWVNFSMAIPSMAAGSWTEPGVYSVANLANGDTSIYVERWNVDTGVLLPTHSKSIPLKVPLNLGGDCFDFDGRYMVNPMNPVVRGCITSYTSAADTRVLEGGSWTLPTGLTHSLKLMVGDDSNDAAYAEVGHGIGFYTQGTSTRQDDQGYNVTAFPSPYILAGEVGFVPTTQLATGRQQKYLVRGAMPSGDLTDIFEAVAGSGNPGSGINVIRGAVRVGRDYNSDLTAADAMGAQFHHNGYLKVARDSFLAEWKRHTTVGTVQSFVYGNTQVGTISVTATNTAYNVTSDATLKKNKGTLSYEDALAIMELITIHNFEWLETGDDDVGVFAQELYEIYPRAVSVGGWYLEDGSPADEGTEGAIYSPWGVDYSKLMPIIVRVLQEVAKRVLT